MAKTSRGRTSKTPPKKQARSRKKKRSAGKIIGRTVLVFVVIMALAGVGVGGYTAMAYQKLEVPDPNAEFTTNTSYVYYAGGKKQLGEVEVQNRQSISYAEMPDSIKNAVVAAENKTFWSDPGYSIAGMIRAGGRILRGGSLQSGSTITQQYIKIMYLSQDQTITRKFNELLLARKLSQQMDKREILAGYLNTIYFGRGAYGIQAASQAYFNKDAADLTVPQAAVLASVLNSPGYFDPDANGGDPEPLLGRYRYVISEMGQAGLITPEETTKYAKKLPKLPKIKTSDKYGGSEGFLMKAVESELANLPLDQAKVRGGGYQIITTFDRKAQVAAEKAAKKYTKESAELAGRKASKLHAAIASVDTETGGVVAMYGGPDYVKNQRNWATTPRATASTFKPFALAAGLENGFSLYSTMNGNTFTPPGDGVPIRNEFSMQYGQVSLLRSTAESINTSFVDLTTKLPGDGPQKVLDTAKKLGAVKTSEAQDWDKTNRVAIGSAQVSPLNMASAYATFANDGVTVGNHVIAKIIDADGDTIYQAEPEGKRAISKDVAADVTFALQGVVKDGTGAAAQQLGRPVAGKTGTQGVDDKITSAWFTGYTKQVATSVMYVAGDGGNADLDNYKRPWDPTFFGSSYPAMTWVDYMQSATEGQPVEDFAQPAYVNRTSYPPQNTSPQYPSNNDNNQNQRKNDRDQSDNRKNKDRDQDQDRDQEQDSGKKRDDNDKKDSNKNDSGDNDGSNTDTGDNKNGDNSGSDTGGDDSNGGTDDGSGSDDAPSDDGSSPSDDSSDAGTDDGSTGKDGSSDTKSGDTKSGDTKKKDTRDSDAAAGSS